LGAASPNVAALVTAPNWRLSVVFSRLLSVRRAREQPAQLNNSIVTADGRRDFESELLVFFG
jgi:hypothetical protein